MTSIPTLKGSGYRIDRGARQERMAIALLIFNQN